ncbi:hypothetical protein SAMN02745244_02598, partial [Tessaracoccus bendigoensis DSM 12906]
MGEDVPRLFAGVGISNYVNHSTLPQAVADVEAVHKLLRIPERTPLLDPDKDSVGDFVGSLHGAMPDGGLIVFMWSGHGKLDGGLRLITADDDTHPDGVAFTEAIRPLVKSRAHQLLFMVDVCHAGEAATSMEMIRALVNDVPPADDRVWAGVLASCQQVETARDGLFGEVLTRLLTRGPSEDGVIKWPSGSKFISGEELGSALLSEWPEEASQRPRFSRDGLQLALIPNPLFKPELLPARIVEHLLLAARGGADEGEASAFTGRVAEVNQVVGWVRSEEPGMHVVTGAPGTGKSAILGRVVSLSDAGERCRLLSSDPSLAHEDPGERSVHAAVHVRGLTADQTAQRIHAQLVAAGVLDPESTRECRNVNQFLGDVEAAFHDGGVPVVAVDGVDEARGEAFDIASGLLVPLSRWATVMVATRNLNPPTGEGGEFLIDALSPTGAELDLADPGIAAQGVLDLREYILRRLSGVASEMDPGKVADLLTGTASSASLPFLLARLVTSQLIHSPIDSGVEGWQELVAASLPQALERDLAAVAAPAHRDDIDEPAFAKLLVTALSWALGSGLPLPEWAAIADALSDGAYSEITPPDQWWVLEQLGRYLIQDVEAEQAVYRIAHASIIEWLRPPSKRPQEVFTDPNAQMVSGALLNRYEALLREGISAQSTTYLWRYAWRHAAEAGPTGVDRLRTLSSISTALLPDVASASLEVAAAFRTWGKRAEALPPTQESVTIYQGLAEQNPAFLPDLA